MTRDQFNAVSCAGEAVPSEAWPDRSINDHETLQVEPRERLRQHREVAAQKLGMAGIAGGDQNLSAGERERLVCQLDAAHPAGHHHVGEKDVDGIARLQQRQPSAALRAIRI